MTALTFRSHYDFANHQKEGHYYLPKQDKVAGRTRTCYKCGDILNSHHDLKIHLSQNHFSYRQQNHSRFMERPWDHRDGYHRRDQDQWRSRGEYYYAQPDKYSARNSFSTNFNSYPNWRRGGF